MARQQHKFSRDLYHGHYHILTYTDGMAIAGSLISWNVIETHYVYRHRRKGKSTVTVELYCGEFYCN